MSDTVVKYSPVPENEENEHQRRHRHKQQNDALPGEHTPCRAVIGGKGQVKYIWYDFDIANLQQRGHSP